MTDGATRRIFVAMLREEWRMHSHLFRGSHFAAFPILIAVVTAATAWLLTTTGTSPGTIFAGLHALVFVFGLHTGSIGFVGRDALQNLLGDLTLVVFSARTLPLSQDRLLALFVVKDLVYYMTLFLVPIALGTIAAINPPTGSSGVVSMAGTAVLLWTTLTLSFSLGLGVTLAALGLTRRGRRGLALVAALGVASAAAVGGRLDVAAYTPYGVFRTQSLPRVTATLVTIAGVFLIAAHTFDASARRRARTVGPSFRRWRRRIGDPVATKTLLDVHRSAGGFGKVVFSAAILLGVTAGLVDLAGKITGVSPSVGISFGVILGLTGFTTYNWLTQTDDIDAYRVQPLPVAAVFAAKFRAFLLLGPVVGLACYALAVAWRGGPLLDVLVGAVLLVGVACYSFGTTVYLTGLSPNEFLFDTTLFAVFGAAMVVALVPSLVVGFALAPVSSGWLAALAVGGVVLGLTGVGLYRRALPKWTERYRQG